MPKFSVIVPAYNVETYIDRCVMSILNQTYSDFELIIIDDGSTDGTGKKLDDYALSDARIHVVHSRNQGQSAARNKGLEICSGEYVYFCDSDDWIEPDILERCLETFEQEHSDIVRFQSFTHIGEKVHTSGFDMKRDTIRYGTPSEKLSFICDDVLKYRIGWELCLGAYRNDVLQKNKLRFPSGINIAEDLYLLLLSIICGNSCAFIDKPLYHYCLRDDSTMGQNKGIIRLDNTNELAYQLYLRSSEHRMQELFYLIHNQMMMNEMGGYHSMKMSRETAVGLFRMISDISRYDFFIEQTEKALHHSKCYYFRQFGFYSGGKRIILNRLIINRNYSAYSFSFYMLGVLNVPVRVFNKITRKLRNNQC